MELTRSSMSIPPNSYSYHSYSINNPSNHPQECRSMDLEDFHHPVQPVTPSSHHRQASTAPSPSHAHPTNHRLVIQSSQNPSHFSINPNSTSRHPFNPNPSIGLPKTIVRPPPASLDGISLSHAALQMRQKETPSQQHSTYNQIPPLPPAQSRLFLQSHNTSPHRPHPAPNKSLSTSRAALQSPAPASQQHWANQTSRSPCQTSVPNLQPNTPVPSQAPQNKGSINATPSTSHHVNPSTSNRKRATSLSRLLLEIAHANAHPNLPPPTNGGPTSQSTNTNSGPTPSLSSDTNGGPPTSQSSNVNGGPTTTQSTNASEGLNPCRDKITNDIEHQDRSAQTITPPSAHNLPRPTRGRPRKNPPPADTELDTQSSVPPASRKDLTSGEPDQLPDHIMDELRKLELNELARRANSNATHNRLTVENSADLDELYLNYQKEISLFALKNKLPMDPVLRRLGHATRFRGPTMYNNFCQYDPDGRKAFHDENLTPAERQAKCGELWHKLDSDSQKKYNNPDYLRTLPNPFGEFDLDPEDDPANPQHQSKKSLPSQRFNPKDWVRKIEVDLRNISASYNVEGFMVLVSRMKSTSRSAINAGASLFGQQFLDMFSRPEEDIGEKFYDFVNGQKTIQQTTGKDPLIPKIKRTRKGNMDMPDCRHDLGSKNANAKSISDQLCKLMRDATHGKWSKGWPGTHTAETLKKYKVKLMVVSNPLQLTPSEFCCKPGKMTKGTTQRILTGLAEGWVKLEGPPKDSDDPIGASDDTDSDNESNAAMTANEANVATTAACDNEANVAITAVLGAGKKRKNNPVKESLQPPSKSRKTNAKTPAKRMARRKQKSVVGSDESDAATTPGSSEVSRNRKTPDLPDEELDSSLESLLHGEAGRSANKNHVTQPSTAT